MKPGTLALIMTLFSINSIAASEPFIFGVSQTNFSIGAYQVESCDIVIPDLGVSKDSVTKQLSQKGYHVMIVGDDLYQSTFGAGAYASKTLQSDADMLKPLNGLAYLNSEVVVGLAVAQTKLILKVIGENGMDGLYTSSGYDANFIPGHSDLFDASDIPNCVTKK